MVDIEARIQHAIEEISGNEALLEMLETDAALEMLNWGKTLAASLVRRTGGMDDIEAELELLPRLKAVRQFMRSIGNWAAGKYKDPASRVQLRDKLLEYFRTIFGEHSKLPSASQMDTVLNEVDNPQNNPHQLILKVKELLNEFNTGDSNNVPTS